MPSNPMLRSQVESLVRWVLPFVLGKIGWELTADAANELIAWIVTGLLLAISLGWSWLSQRRLYQIDPLTGNRTGATPPPVIKAPSGSLPVLLLLVSVAVLLTLGGCATNSQRLDADGLALDGGPASLNTLAVQGDQYRIVGRNTVGISDMRGGGFSFAGDQPFSTLRIDATAKSIDFGSGTNFEIGALSATTEGEKSTITLDGVQVSASDVALANAQTAAVLYAAMQGLSKDEAEVRVKQLELSGKITEAAGGILRAMLGI
jgi:hypothetical protein